MRGVLLKVPAGRFAGVGRKSGLFAFLWLALSMLSIFAFALPAGATTGVNEQINYQARLLDGTGAVVADGTYNMEFKIYQDGTGCESGGTSPCGGTLKWTETRTGSSKVTVTNGYFAVQLGSVTPFGSSVDWNQDTLWLSLNVGGTGTPSWDGEMLPFRRMAATPYALNAKQLGGLDWSKFVQVAPSAVQTDSSTLSTLFLNKTGASGNILQLQKNSNNVVVVGNDGLVTLAGGLTKDFTTADATTAAALTIQPGTSSGASSNGSALNLKGGDGSGTTTVVGGAVVIQGGAATGASGSRTGGDVTIDAGTGASSNGAINIATNYSAAVNLGATTGGSGINIGRSNGSYTLTLASTVPSSTNTQTVNIASAASGQSSGSTINVNLLSGGAGTNGTATLKIANYDRVNQVDIGNVVADTARTLNVFTGDSTAVDTLNIGTGNTTVAGGKTINIGTGTPTSSGSNLITIGSTALASATTIQSGTGNITLQVG